MKNDADGLWGGGGGEHNAKATWLQYKTRVKLI